MIVCVYLTKEEMKTAKEYARRQKLSLSKAMKNAFFEKLEDEYDIALADAAIRDFKNDPKTYSMEEVKKMFDC